MKLTLSRDFAKRNSHADAGAEISRTIGAHFEDMPLAKSHFEG
jgi:hypothetical protein